MNRKKREYHAGYWKKWGCKKNLIAPGIDTHAISYSREEYYSLSFSPWQLNFSVSIPVISLVSIAQMSIINIYLFIYIYFIKTAK